MNVFISYRRHDCRAEATAIYFALTAELDGASVFFDVESIPPAPISP